MNVHRSFRSPGGPGRVGDEQRVLRVDALVVELIGLVLQQLVPCHVSPVVPRDVGSPEPRPHDHPGDRWAQGGCTVRRFLHGDDPSSSGRPIGRDQDLRFAILEARGHRVGGVAGEDRKVDGAELRAGEGGRHRLRSHWHEDADGVPLAHSQRAQAVGQPVRHSLELRVGDGSNGSLFALPQDGSPVRSGAGPPVDAVVGEVDGPAGEPSGPGPPVRLVQDLPIGLVELDPQVLHHGVPEPCDVVLGALHELVVGADPVGPHEPGDVGPLHVISRRSPNDLAHERPFTSWAAQYAVLQD